MFLFELTCDKYDIKNNILLNRCKPNLSNAKIMLYIKYKSAASVCLYVDIKTNNKYFKRLSDIQGVD